MQKGLKSFLGAFWEWRATLYGAFRSVGDVFVCLHWNLLEGKCDPRDTFVVAFQECHQALQPRRCWGPGEITKEKHLNGEIKYQPVTLTGPTVFVGEAEAFIPWIVVRETRGEVFGRGRALQSAEKKQEENAGLFSWDEKWLFAWQAPHPNSREECVQVADNYWGYRGNQDIRE